MLVSNFNEVWIETWALAWLLLKKFDRHTQGHLWSFYLTIVNISRLWSWKILKPILFDDLLQVDVRWQLIPTANGSLDKFDVFADSSSTHILRSISFPTVRWGLFVPVLFMLHLVVHFMNFHTFKWKHKRHWITKVDIHTAENLTRIGPVLNDQY